MPESSATAPWSTGEPLPFPPWGRIIRSSPNPMSSTPNTTFSAAGDTPLSSSVPGMHPARSTAHTGRAFFH